MIDQCNVDGCQERCYKEGIGYIGTCVRCKEKQIEEGMPKDQIIDYSYIGETARSLYTRSKQHLDAYRSNFGVRKPIDSWMWEHTMSHHEGVVGAHQGAMDYQFRLQGIFRKPLQRQVDEAVRLGQVEKHGRILDDVYGGGTVTSLNSRGEFFTPKIVQYNFAN